MDNENELNENELNPPVMDGYTKIPTFKLWVANRFPYMETDFDALTNYELMNALVDYLNNVIKNEENVESNVAKLNQAYLELFNYVKDYFNNLDVQEEINNKLDDLVEDGTLNRLIGNYINPYLTQFNETIENQNARINNLNNKVNSATNGNPLVASSTSDMTDTSKIYVNTTDGKWYYYNGTSWVIGGTYQSNVEGVYQLFTTDIFKPYYNGIRPLYNMINNSSIDENKYYYNNNGTIEKRSSNGYYTFDKFPVKGGETYHLYRNNNPTGNIAKPFSYLVNPDGTVIETLTGADIHQFTPSQDGYVYLTVIKSNDYDYSTTVLTLINYQPRNFTEYNIPYNFLINNKNFNDMYNAYLNFSENYIIKYNEILVGVNERYTTITDAINSINDATSINRYNIIIDDGTYNEHSINLPNYVNLIGASGNRDNCIIRGYLNPSVSDNEHRSVSTIDLSMNNELKNLTITAQNMRYPIHDESNGVNTDWIQLVDNCHIEHLGNQEIIDYRSEHELDPGNPWASCHAWGEGASSGANLTIKDTTLKSVENAFYVHGASNMVKPYHHELINCKLITSNEKQIAIYVDNTTPTIDDNTLIVKNCFIGGRYAIVANTHKYNAMFSGSGIKPVYQRPGQVCADWSFPLFTDYMDEYIAGETLTKGTFVYTTDGHTIFKATPSIDKNLIVGYVIGDKNVGDLTKVMKGYLQPSSQTWPETPMTSNKYFTINNNGLLVETQSVDNALAFSNDYAYKLFI